MVKICKDGRIWGQHNSYKKEEYKENQSLLKLDEKNSKWKGGNSRCYARKTYLPLKYSMIQKCSLCSSTEKLVVHHIDKNYKNNILENLQIVCKGCHNKIHKSKKEMLQGVKQ